MSTSLVPVRTRAVEPFVGDRGVVERRQAGPAPAGADGPRPARVSAPPRDSPREALADAAPWWRTLTERREAHGGLFGGDAAAASAARRLGVNPDSPPGLIERRFRALVRAGRPDLGTMDADELADLARARGVLRAVHADRHWIGFGGPAVGSTLDARA